MNELPLKQYLAVAFLSSGKSTADTAKSLNISESSIEKWRCKEDFKKALREASKEIYTALDCAEELSRIATDPEVSDRVKISAIQLVFSQLEKARNWEL